MKKAITLSISFSALILLSFTLTSPINNCYLSFSKANKLVMMPPEHMPEENDHTRSLATEKGNINITILDGYRVLYNNNKNVPFVNLKVERSKPDVYETDKANLLANLSYLNSHSSGMETKDLIVLNYNGFKIYGLSRNGIEAGSTLGIFIMFPGDDTTVYFYFNNLKPEFRNFESLDDYKAQRNTFIADYTKHLVACKGK